MTSKIARVRIVLSAALALLPSCSSGIKNALVCARGETVTYRSYGDGLWILDRQRSWFNLHTRDGYMPSFDERCWTERQP